MRISRRALFFFAVTAVFLVMIPLTPPEYRWLNLVMAGLSMFWAVLLWVEEVSQRRGALDEPPGTVAPDDPDGRAPS